MLIAITVIIALVDGAMYFLQKNALPIGGDRDERGCLVAAGYSFDEQVGACIRAFEMTPDIKQAAILAVEHVGGGYALTVTSFNSYEEAGSYDIMLERGEERTKETVYIRQGQVVELQRVKIYYYSEERDRDEEGNIQCSKEGLVAVDRTIPPTQTPLKDSIELLIKGELIASETERGITTEFPLAGVVLKSASITNGVATLTFDDPQNKTSGGSCRVSVLWAQIEATAKQFPAVQTVRFMPEEVFQP